MICKQCGAENQQDNKTCEVCGATLPLLGSENLQIQIPYGKNIIRADSKDQVVFYIKKRFGVIIGCTVIGVIATVTGISLITSLLKRPDLTDYINVIEQGVDGHGKVSLSVDSDTLKDKLFGEKNDELSIEDVSKLALITSYLQKNAVIEGDSQNISNGDKLTISINNLEEISGVTGIKFRNHDKLEYEVHTLQDAINIGISDLVDATFLGFDGAGCVELSVKTSDKIPFDLRGNGTTLYIDDNSFCRCNIEPTGSEGKLSNGDKYSINFNISSETEEYLLDKYSVFIDKDLPAEFSVSGLNVSETLDAFSLFDITVSGLDGKATTNLFWKSTDITNGKLHIVTDNEKSDFFSVYSYVYVPNETLYFMNDVKNIRESHIADFYINPSKSNDISSGEEITFTLQSNRWNEDDLSVNSYEKSGLLLSEITHSVKVDNSMLDRYITSEDQMQVDMIKNYGDTQFDYIKDYLIDNWSNVVHESGNFVSYDQELKETPKLIDIYYAQTSESKNTFTVWMVYSCICIDSETPDGKNIYVLLEVDNPIISGSDSSKITTYELPNVSAYQSMKEIEDKNWFKDSENLQHYEMN